MWACCDWCSAHSRAPTTWVNSSSQSRLAFVSPPGAIIFLDAFLSHCLSSPIFRKTDTVRHGEFTGLFVESSRFGARSSSAVWENENPKPERQKHDTQQFNSSDVDRRFFSHWHRRRARGRSHHWREKFGIALPCRHQTGRRDDVDAHGRRRGQFQIRRRHAVSHGRSCAQRTRARKRAIKPCSRRRFPLSRCHKTRELCASSPANSADAKARRKLSRLSICGTSNSNPLPAVKLKTRSTHSSPSK